MNQKGQIIVIVLLVTLVALSLGLVVTQKSITDVTTSTQNDQASRAFSAAEAGIEKALTLSAPGTVSVLDSDLNNQASAIATRSAELPTSPTEVLEYPPIGREAVANFWLSQPKTETAAYTAATVNIYFGDSTQTYSASNPKPAIEVTFFYKNGTNYESSSKYLDSDQVRSSTGNPTNGFTYVTTTASPTTFDLKTFTSKTTDKPFFKATASIFPTGCGTCNTPILARVRLLYSTSNQRIALGPSDGETQSLPMQATAYQATGKAGQSQKSLKVFKESYVVPHFFDFALFSVGNITK